MKELAKCGATGCDGLLEFGTDAIGRTVERCPKCSARKTVARTVAPAVAATAATPASNGKAARSWDNCERTFTSQAWLDRHVKRCTGTPSPAASAAPKPRTAPPAARPAPQPPPPAAAPPAAPRRYPITIATIERAARFVGIPDDQAARLVELIRFLGTLDPAEVA